jgi:spore coat protein A
MTAITRRRFLECGAGAGAGLVLWRWQGGRAYARPPGVGVLDPRSIPKYETALVIPPAMPRTSTIARKGGRSIEYFEIAVGQFEQRILPPGMHLPPTTVWSYGSVNHAGSFNYPAFTIEATWRRPVRVKWINGLVDAKGGFLPHLLPVDQTLHWANPAAGTAGRDRHGTDQTP